MYLAFTMVCLVLVKLELWVAKNIYCIVFLHPLRGSLKIAGFEAVKLINNIKRQHVGGYDHMSYD